MKNIAWDTEMFFSKNFNFKRSIVSKIFYLQYHFIDEKKNTEWTSISGLEFSFLFEHERNNYECDVCKYNNIVIVQSRFYTV